MPAIGQCETFDAGIHIMDNAPQFFARIPDRQGFDSLGVRKNATDDLLLALQDRCIDARRRRVGN